MNKFVMVPVEPTEEMLIDMGIAALPDCLGKVDKLPLLEMYKAMLQASPVPSAEPVAWMRDLHGFKSVVTAEEKIDPELIPANPVYVAEHTIPLYADPQKEQSTDALDAKRYRWLRAQHQSMPNTPRISTWQNGERKALIKESADRAVDAAIAQAEKK